MTDQTQAQAILTGLTDTLSALLDPNTSVSEYLSSLYQAIFNVLTDPMLDTLYAVGCCKALIMQGYQLPETISVMVSDLVENTEVQ